jgi:hypothetical protein
MAWFNLYWASVINVSGYISRHTDRELQYMALGAVGRSGLGALAELFVASNALLVKGVGTFGIFGILHVRGIMTFQTIFGNDALLRIIGMAATAIHNGHFIIGGVVVAIVAGQTITAVRGVRLMIEEHFAGIGLIHNANGLVGRFDWKSGVTYDRNYKQMSCHAVHDLPVLFRNHLH